MSMRRGLYIAALVLLLIVVLVVLSQSTLLPDNQLAGGIVDMTVGAAEGTVNTFSGFFERLITPPQSGLARILLIVAGFVLLLIGWRIYNYIVVIAGAVVGAAIALSLVTTDNTMVATAATIIGALIGGALGAFLYYVAVFVIGAYVGIILTSAAAAMISTAPLSEVVLLIGAILGGLILLGLSFEFLVLLGALVGAQMLTLGLGLPLIWTVIFAAIGVLVQLALMRRYNFDFRRRRTVIA